MDTCLPVLAKQKYNHYLRATTRVFPSLQIIVVLFWHHVLAKSLNQKVRRRMEWPVNEAILSGMHPTLDSQLVETANY